MDDETYKLPGQDDTSPIKKNKAPGNPAADLIRRKVEEAYSSEPNAAAEIQAVRAQDGASSSKHQKYIQNLMNSGKPVAEVQTEWHEYYTSLPDSEKHIVWQEFYAAQAAEAKKDTKRESNDLIVPSMADARPAKLRKAKSNPFHSLAFGISAGIVVIFVVLFSFFNERFIAPFIQPSRSLSNVPLITNTPVGPDPQIIIPKINVQIPVIYNLKTIDEEAIQNALEGGVVHYADTALPGYNGNAVFVGHSSNNIFNKGKYKFAFVLLSRLEPGDTFYLQKDGKRYTYEVYQKKIVKPNDVSVLGPSDRAATATLITCDPPGTSINRLVVTGEQISPSPSKNKPLQSKGRIAEQTKVIPSNSESLWSRIWNLLGR
ncbi:MAG TPA: sortase [Candidatus Saccharimonadales bacterium]|nr:sortase [Candidatus Saccharimonadales bacterium]